MTAMVIRRKRSHAMRNGGSDKSRRIILLSGNGFFDPEVLGAMNIAYDAVRISLGSAATVAVCDGVANRIIEAGRAGERDRIRLIEAGLGSLRRKP